MKADQELVKNILNNYDRYDWSVQGLGMLGTYLSQELRLHIWHSRYIIPDVTTIHDHPWDFESSIICGAIYNHKFIEVDIEKWAGASPYNKMNILCGPDMLVSDTIQQVYLLGYMPRIYGASETYTQQAAEIHKTFFLDGTVTLIKRKFGNDRDHANVFYRTNFVSATPRPATKDEIYTGITSAMELLERG